MRCSNDPSYCGHAIMQGYTANLKASKDGSLRFNETSGLVNDEVLNTTLAEVYGDLQFSDLGSCR